METKRSIIQLAVAVNWHKKSIKSDMTGWFRVINLELCKKFKFDYMNKYIHNPESVLENETHKLLWYFEIEIDLLISARQPDLVIANKKKNIPNSGWQITEWK